MKSVDICCSKQDYGSFIVAQMSVNILEERVSVCDMRIEIFADPESIFQSDKKPLRSAEPSQRQLNQKKTFHIHVPQEREWKKTKKRLLREQMFIVPVYRK